MDSSITQYHLISCSRRCPDFPIFCRIVQFLYYSDVDQIMRKSLLVSVFFDKKKTKQIRRHVSSLSKITIKLKFYYSNLKNAVETAKIAVDS